MGDLISRSALTEALEKHYNSLTYENVPTSIADFYCEMEKLFKEQPTAYNVEKVVAELEEEREYSYADFEEYVNEKSPCLDAEYDDYFHRGLERAIKLVRKGGA